MRGYGTSIASAENLLWAALKASVVELWEQADPAMSCT
jgi:hypothetical protein